ncbi:MAG: ABC transporter substrate-binding protein, partial [Cyanobacteria bacterium J06576_12]
MTLSRRQFKKLLLGAGLSATLTVSCTSSNTPEADTATDTAADAAPAAETPTETVSLRLAQNLSPISGVAIVAIEQGFFEAQGLD